MAESLDPISDDEIIYRRIPVSTNWYSPESRELKAYAFQPNEADTTGISVSRAKYSSLEEAARGRPGKSYFVAVLNAGEIRAAGISLEPQPHTPNGIDPAHAELPELNAGNKKTTSTQERQRKLARLVMRVEGPFSEPSPTPGVSAESATEEP